MTREPTHKADSDESLVNTGDDGAEDQGTGIGLFRYRDDVLALLEILARGVHGWPV